MNRSSEPGLASMRLAALCAALFASAWATAAAASAPALDALAIPCEAGETNKLLTGGQAGPGTTFSVAIGMIVPTPAKPVNGWTLARCNAEQVFFTRTEAARKDVMTALASHIGLSPWTDDESFEREVRRTIDGNRLPGQHLKTVVLRALVVDGRPCVDVLRTGTVDPTRAADGAVTPMLFTRERVRTCHLRDARGPEAAVMMMFKEIAPYDPLGFDATALPFLDSVRLPPATP